MKMLANLDPLPSDVRKWRVLLLVSAVNSLTQRMQTYLADMGCTRVSTELALTDENMVSAVLAHSPHVIICPFLTKKVPDVVYNNVSTPCLGGRTMHARHACHACHARQGPRCSRRLSGNMHKPSVAQRIVPWPRSVTQTDLHFGVLRFLSFYRK